MSVDIQLDESTKIVTDKYQWFVCKPSNKTNEDGSVTVNWLKGNSYTSLQQLLEAEGQQRMRDSDARSIQDLLEVQATFIRLLQQSLPQSVLSDLFV